MKKYKCHKVVWAMKIVGFDFPPTGEENKGVLLLGQEQNEFVSQEYFNHHNPEVGGYYVKYSDGYESYSPAKAFEEGYSPFGKPIDFKEISNGLFTKNYTVVHGGDFTFNAYHEFSVTSKEGDDIELARIKFQKGPIKEAGINGVANEDLILMVITRLQQFQASPYQCRENALALTKLEEAVMWLRKRTMDREARGVEGTHNV